MSREVEAWAREQKTGDPVRKAVLMALGNYADPFGRNCYPSIPRVAEEVEVSVRTVQRHLNVLEDMGLVKRVERLRDDGSLSSNLFTFPTYQPPKVSHRLPPLGGGDKLTPGGDNLSPAGDAAVTGGGDTGVTTNKPHLLPFPPSASGEAESPPTGDDQQQEEEPQKVKSKTGHRLPADWSPPPVTDLPLTVQVVLRQWPAGAYEFVAAQFAAYWTGESGRKGSKRDWDAAWIKWITTESPRILQAKRQGQKFAVPKATAEKGASPEARRLVAMQASEDDDAAQLRMLLKDAMNEVSYEAWLNATMIQVNGRRVVVAAPSLFIRDQIAIKFGDLIEQVELARSGTAKEVRIEVLR